MWCFHFLDNMCERMFAIPALPVFVFTKKTSSLFAIIICSQTTIRTHNTQPYTPTQCEHVVWVQTSWRTRRFIHTHTHTYVRPTATDAVSQSECREWNGKHLIEAETTCSGCFFILFQWAHSALAGDSSFTETNLRAALLVSSLRLPGIAWVICVRSCVWNSSMMETRETVVLNGSGPQPFCTKDRSGDVSCYSGLLIPHHCWRVITFSK